MSIDNYQEFLNSKQKTFIQSGFDIDESELNSNLFDFQKYIELKDKYFETAEKNIMKVLSKRNQLKLEF